MKRFLLLLGLAIALIAPAANAQGKGKSTNDELLRISRNAEPPTFGPDASSFPRPFNQLNNPIDQAGISTGYYFVDSDDDAPDFWRPSPEIVDTTTEAALWRRIVPGPRILPSTYWAENPAEGLRFFRNPASGDFFDHENNAVDSSDDAIAGPIPIGFAFYFNGLRFDSFYVSTNGIIALSNRRYFYDVNGQRTVPGGATSAYDPMAIEWFETFRNRTYADSPDDNLTGPGTGDLLADDYGYQYVVLGNSPTNAQGGIRARGTYLNSLPYKAHVISPFWGDGHLSQFLPATNSPDDYGKVYFKRSLAADKLIIYFVNYSLKGTLSSPVGSKSVSAHKRRGEQDYIGSNCQVILNRIDSSVTVVFESFDGNLTVSGRNIPAATIFRYNSTLGVGGFARHVNYRRPEGLPTNSANYPWAGEYRQYTHYYGKFADPNVSYPHPYLAVRFKQWQNTLAVVDITYRTRKMDPNSGLEFTETVKSADVADYELLAGEERIGAIQPIAIIQNLTNEIQGPTGVNFLHQNKFSYRARFRIVNEANQKIIYNRLVPVDSSCLILADSITHLCTGDPDVKVRYVKVEIASGNVKTTELPFPRVDSVLVDGTWRKTTYGGIPPYGFSQIFFPPFSPNEFLDNQIGRMRAFIIADPTDIKSESLGDEWPFDDTASVRLYVMKRLEEFYDDVTEYHIIDRVPMPSVLKWVNIEGEVAPGDEISNHPLPPIGEYTAMNNQNFRLNSPVIRLNRKTLDGGEPVAPKTGDEIRSFPIDMRDRYNSVLSFSIQRMHKQDDWPRGWCDQQLIGPEPRAVINGGVLTPWTTARSASARPDWIAVEFAKPSPDGIRGITNIAVKNWMDHPRRGGAKAVTNMSAFALYGAGGYLLGFLETDKDSALDQPSSTALNGLRPNLYDDGIDFEFSKFFIGIPDTFINAPAEGAKNFRFRVRVDATNDRKCIVCIPDDDDPFYVDNIKILFPPEITDIEVATVKVRWPYTMAPASQATELPISVKVSNNTSIDAPRFQVKVKIFRGNIQNWRSQEGPIYCRTQAINNLTAGKETEVQMPTWDARKCGPGLYTLQAIIVVDEGDLDQRNDTTYSEVNLRFGDAFAYDPVQNPRNDVPDQSFTGIPGKGLNLFAFAVGGYGNRSGLQAPNYEAVNHGSGTLGGSGSGQIAMKFTLASTDTIYGYQAYYGIANQAFDDISFEVYSDVGGRQPGQMIGASLIFRQRMWDDVKDTMIINEYTNYMLKKPLVLYKGTYWAVIGQMGQTGLELAASKTRVGMRTTSIYIPPPGNTSDYGAYPLGAAGIHLNIEKTFRKLSPARNLVNDNFFCFENTRGNDQWTEFMPAQGNPGYAHLDHYGMSPSDAYTYTLSRGTWIPMLRPYFKSRSYQTNAPIQQCPDDVPVNLVDFNGEVRNNAINLYWSTATEENNRGFRIERKVEGSNNDFETIAFVNGNGTSNVVNYYNFIDKAVTPKTTYQYRLRQVDFDGVETCPTEEIVTLTVEGTSELVLEENVPNPVVNNTSIAFTLPARAHAKLEVIDLFGNVVKVLADKEFGGSVSYPFIWDGNNEAGVAVPNGTYICRLTTNNDVRTIKMSVVR